MGNSAPLRLQRSNRIVEVLYRIPIVLGITRLICLCLCLGLFVERLDYCGNTADQNKPLNLRTAQVVSSFENACCTVKVF